MFLQEDHVKAIVFFLDKKTNMIKNSSSLNKKKKQGLKQMPTTETVRTDYRRWKNEKKKSISRKKTTPPALHKNKIETHNYVIICLFAPTAPQLSLQIQVQISQKTWMRNVQFYYTYCYTKYRRIKSWNNSPVPTPPSMKKCPP